MESILAYAQENSAQGSSMSTFWFILGAIGLWKMFEKAGVPGWAGIIPLYRDYKLCEKVMGNPWYWVRVLVLVFIPVIGWIGAIYFEYQICLATAKAYGKPDGWAWGYLFLAPVFWLITGFDSSSYYGPFGSGDNRTGEARQAKTVDFDVIKNEPAQPAQEEPAPAAEESDVDFDFNQDVGE